MLTNDGVSFEQLGPDFFQILTDISILNEVIGATRIMSQNFNDIT